MKKLTALILMCALALLAFTGCFIKPTEKLEIGYMTGPTGMGMAKLIHDSSADAEKSSYSFTSFANTTDAKAKLTQGEIDIICLPTNEAAEYRNKVDDDLVVLAINCLNSLFVISDNSSNVSSLSDLVGKTVYTAKNGTPRKILEYIITSLELDITVSYTTPDGKEMAAPADVRAQAVNGNLPYAVLPEPLVTSIILATASTSNPYSSDIDLADEWEKISPSTPVAMGCVVTTKTFLEDNKRAIEKFLDDYEDSIEFIGDAKNLELAANYVAETKIMEKAPAAKKALANLSGAIEYIDGDDMKDTLKSFYSAIGITSPADDFYYDD